MKMHRYIFSTLLLCFILYEYIFGNIMPETLISEYTADSTGWKIEIMTYLDTLHLDDNYYMTSVDDTAYFKDSVKIYSENSDSLDYNPTYGVISNESMQTDFQINTQQDTVRIKSIQDTINYPKEPLTLIFGYSTFPPAPKEGQSICYNNGIAYFNYLDNSPTIGYENDTINATGQLNIQITNSDEEPLKDIYCYRRSYMFYVTMADTSDDEGEIQLNLISGHNDLFFSPADSLQNYHDFYQYSNYLKKGIVVYPETSKSVRIQIPDSILTEIRPSGFNRPIIKKYILSDNYPNPFNNSTTFNYQIPIDDYVEINLYDIQGRLVKSMESGFKKSGKYEVHPDFTDLHSGIYFYRLETGNRTITKKCMFLK